jgi:peptide/nickel transport system substrate-binding protein
MTIRLGRWARSAFAAGAVALLGAALAPQADARTFRMSVSGDANTMDPHSQNAGNVTLLLRQIYEPLVMRGKKLEIEPGLATAWQQLEPTRWRFTLRPNVRFSNGNAFNADDVVYSIQRSLHEFSQYGIFTDTIGEAVKVNDLTVDIITKVPDPVLIDKLTSVFIMDLEWSQQNNAMRPQNVRGREEAFTGRNAMGTGPFMVRSREPDVRTVLVQNANWWNNAARESNVTEIVFQPIASAATRTAALRSGEIDFVLDPPVQDVPQLQAAQGLKVVTGPEVRTLFIAFDTSRDELQYSSVKGRNPFKDIRVRLAMYHAINIDAIHTRVMRGQSVNTGAFYPDAVNGYSKEWDKRYPFNIAEARNLMRQAGYPDGFEVTLDCSNNRYINDEAICQALVAMWAQIGIRANLNSQPLATFFPKIQRDDTSLYMLGWGVPTYDALYSLQSLLRTRDGQPGNGIWNHGRFSDPDFDRLIDRVKLETNANTRRGYIAELNKLIHERAPIIPLHHQMIPWAMRANIDVVHRADNQLEVKWVRVN